jgi:hypothetical protein
MRFRGQEYTGRGQTIAIVDSGVDIRDPRLAGADVNGMSISMSATAHVLIAADFADENGHGTEIAAAIHAIAPDATLLCIKIMDARLRTSADLMAAGIELGARSAGVINLSLGTPNMGKALLLRDVCAHAVEAGAVVLAAIVLRRRLKLSQHVAFNLFAALAVLPSVGAALALVGLTGAVAWSRLKLGRHTRAEIGVGTVVGLVVGALFQMGLRFIRG